MKHLKILIQKTWFWLVLLAAAALVSGGFYALRGGAAGTVAGIYVDGELWDSVDLSAVAMPYEITVETELGYNTVLVSHGEIKVAHADCTEQVCVNQGAISDSLIPIVCLPHHLVIRIEEP